MGVSETQDAARRTRLANERTYLAWWRTGLAAFAVCIGIGRIVPGVSRLAADWLPPEVKPRLDTVRQNVLSLSDYDAHTSTKFSCCSTPPSA